MKTFEKDVNAVLDYYWDWTDWIPEGEAIDSVEFESSSEDLVVDSYIIMGTKVVAMISGGVLGTNPTITNRVFTDGSPPKSDDRTVRFIMIER